MKTKKQKDESGNFVDDLQRRFQARNTLYDFVGLLHKLGLDVSSGSPEDSRMSWLILSGFIRRWEARTKSKSRY